MRLVRPAALLVAVVALGATAASARSGIVGPTGLHAFLLRADEAAQTRFSRTPSFAWNPVPGADHYEFQLSLNTSFHDNSVVFADSHAPTPVEAPHVTLPWITGSPHSLYARVRAITPTGATPWSKSFGFDMVPPAPPVPVGSYPGVLRWSPVDGALGYEVWLVDIGKMEGVRTNVLDERDFYTFHQGSSWTGTVHWRVRALRTDVAERINGIPAVQYGAWSPVYTSVNPPVADAPLKLLGTVSDTFSDGSATAPAQGLMPAFMWSGDESLSGNPFSLYRVYVFTDAQCLNRVFTSAIVGGPAYAPRPLGPLALPGTVKDLAAAQSTYLADGAEPKSYTFDGEAVTPTESEPQATPTTSVPGSPGDTTPSSSSSSSSSSSGSAAPGSITFSGNVGAPTDLWDVNWPDSGYYWTVVPVEPVQVDASGTLFYADAELPQDACAAGRVMRFGKESQPSLTSAGNLFATGLSSTGRLTSARQTTRFYGAPLVSWMPADGADAYEVQWSKSRYPFVPESLSGSPGYMTSTTSVVLPVAPGTWWYRVRGFDYSLPTGSQQMTWSVPAKLVVAKPAFKIIAGAPAKAPKSVKKSVVPSGMTLATGEGFRMDVPASWHKFTLKDSLITFVYRDPVAKDRFHANLNVLRSSGRAGRTFGQWSADLAAGLLPLVGVTPSTSVVTLPAGRAVRLEATTRVNGVPILIFEYIVDAGANAYAVTFECSTASYSSYASSFAKSLASLQLG